MQHLATVIFRIHHIRAGNPDSGRAMAKILGKSWGQNPGDRLHEILGTDSTKGLFFKGFAFLFSNGAYGTIASSLAISFGSRVV